MYVKPTNPAVRVPDPARQGEAPEIYFLPVAGRDVGSDNAFYWFRRMRDGDVVECDPPAVPPAPPPPPEVEGT